MACALLRILYSDGGGGGCGTPEAAEVACAVLRYTRLHFAALEPALCPRATAGRGAWVGLMIDDGIDIIGFVVIGLT